MKHSTRQQAARDTVQIIESGTYLNRRGQEISIRAASDWAVENSRLYRDEDFPASLDLDRIAGEAVDDRTPDQKVFNAFLAEQTR